MAKELTVTYVPDKRPPYEKAAPKDGFLYGWDDKEKEFKKTDKLLSECK